MNQDSEEVIFTKVKIQVRVSDLIKEKDANFLRIHKGSVSVRTIGINTHLVIYNLNKSD